MDKTPIFLIDWLTFSISAGSNHDFNTIIDFLGLDSVQSEYWQSVKGNRFYREAMTFENITIMWNGISDNNYILVEMSGSGCRTFDTFSEIDFFSLFGLINNDEYMQITRLDIAADVQYDLIPIKDVAIQVLNQEWVSASRSYSAIFSNKGITAYVGDNSSARMVRIYDKLSERLYKKIITNFDVWIRFELVLRREYANLFIADLMDILDIGQVFKNHLHSFVRFIKNDATRKERCSDSDWYRDFLQEVTPIRKISRCDTEYSLDKLNYWVTDNMNNAIRTYADIYGWDKFRETIYQRKKPLSPKYYRLREQGKKEQQK